MKDELDRIIDECVDRINGGEGLDACLTSYPEHAEELRPLLRAIFQATEAYSFVPSETSKREARRRFTAALEERRAKREAGQSLLSWVLGRSRLWAPVALVALIAMIGYFGLRPALFPAEAPPETGPAQVTAPPAAPRANPEGNFVFLISDEVNAIGEFQSLDISISTIGLQLGDEAGRWVELDPQVTVVDLTLLPGDKAREIWRGDVPEGRYTKVFIHVAEVRGVLKKTGETVDMKLPGEKLQIRKPFEVSAGSVTSFTYDITVIRAGNAQSGFRYVLRPQVGASGVGQVPRD